jgi:hypothetical protein
MAKGDPDRRSSRSADAVALVLPLGLRKCESELVSAIQAEHLTDTATANVATVVAGAARVIGKIPPTASRVWKDSLAILIGEF